VVRCDWLSIFGSFITCDLFGDAVQFPAHAFDLAQRLSPLCIVQLRNGFTHAAAGPVQNGRRRLQCLRQCSGLCCCRTRPLPLSLQKQLRLGEDALANHG
jgi:hypothetical protein